MSGSPWITCKSLGYTIKRTVNKTLIHFSNFLTFWGGSVKVDHAQDAYALRKKFQIDVSKTPPLGGWAKDSLPSAPALYLSGPHPLL